MSDTTVIERAEEGSVRSTPSGNNELFNQLVAWVAQTSQEGYVPAQIFN